MNWISFRSQNSAHQSPPKPTPLGNGRTVIGVVVISVVTCLGCSDLSIPGQILPRQQPSPSHLIVAHWKKWQEHEQQFSTALDAMTKNTWFGDPAVVEGYYHNLLTLDVSQCPPDYQQAWAECLQASQNLVDAFKAQLGVVGWSTQVAASVATGGLSFAAHAAGFLDAVERKKACDGRIKAIAIKYGVTFN